MFGGYTWIFDGESVAADDPADFDYGFGSEIEGFAFSRTGEDLKCERGKNLLLFHFSDR
jgi:hypothetical protein